jgi:2-keto-4-pentenoate hydratase/2-oxohepta-3-ene-1,7-dioic acid hydratase in catechol pathway
MRLVSFRVPTPVGPMERVGALAPDGRVVGLTAACALHLAQQGESVRAAARLSRALVPEHMIELIEGGARSLDAAREAYDFALRAGEEAGPSGERLLFQSAEIHLLPPVPNPPLLRDFMAFETHLLNIYPKLNREIPPEWYKLPVYYKGNAGSLGAHEEEIPLPAYAADLDFEFELAAVVGKGGANVTRERALAHIYGYMIYNDFSVRSIQNREMSVGLGPAKGKDFNRGHVFGPCLVTADEVPDIYALRMVARVNGEIWCDESSGSMHWKWEDLIAHASMDEYLRPGELLGSGTVGNGSGAERGVFLKPGDVVELTVDQLGTLRNRVVQSSR